jgi:glutathione synthase
MTKALSLAVVMDPIAKIKFAKDSTLAMLLAAAARGWKLTYFEQSDLFLRDGVALGHGRPLEVYNDSQKWFELGKTSVHQLGEFDCVFMRKDPPFDADYIYSTYILERAEIQGAFVANKPQGLRDMNEKVFTAWFPQCCAPTLITRSASDINAFAAEHRKIVVKPLDGMGGKSIFVAEQGDKNLPVIIETLTDFGQRFAIAQRYVPEIAATGDSRVLLIDDVQFVVGELSRLNRERGGV